MFYRRDALISDQSVLCSSERERSIDAAFGKPFSDWHAISLDDFLSSSKLNTS